MVAELHQLRGRVGRSSLQSYCFLIYGKNITEEGKARLKALHESNDGFYIAEQDLKLRGPGEISGTSQSGYLSLAIADLARDKEILKIARFQLSERMNEPHRHESSGDVFMESGINSVAFTQGKQSLFLNLTDSFP